MVIFHSYVAVYQRVYILKLIIDCHPISCFLMCGNTCQLGLDSNSEFSPQKMEDVGGYLYPQKMDQNGRVKKWKTLITHQISGSLFLDTPQ
jgi:hypothetical protein